MIYRVTHRTSYAYSAPVFLEPHTVRLRPRGEACQEVRDFTMSVEPAPAGIHHHLDAEGNCATALWFSDRTAALAVATSFEVRTSCPNPFGYLVADQAFQRLPARYGPEEAAALAPYLAPVEPGAAAAEFAGAVAAEAGRGTLEFLGRLCASIHGSFSQEIREEGPARPPSVTVRDRLGACRDLALLYLAACRSVGLAARFVSGYQEGDADMDERHLHAWAEVYVPGGGWRGYDPSHGLAVADRHIPVAASRVPEGAAAFTGTFRGTGATATMSHRISLARIAE